MFLCILFCWNHQKSWRSQHPQHRKCNHRTLKTRQSLLLGSSQTNTSSVDMRDYAKFLSSFCPRKQHGWDKELHCCRPKNGRHVSWRVRIESYHVSSCFRREIHWFSFTSSHFSTCWSSKKTFPSHLSTPKKPCTQPYPRPYGSQSFGCRGYVTSLFGPWELSKLVQLQVGNLPQLTISPVDGWFRWFEYPFEMVLFLRGYSFVFGGWGGGRIFEYLHISSVESNIYKWWRAVQMIFHS